jgi:hypothetical protein
MDMEHDQALWSEGPKSQPQTHTSNRKSMLDMDLLEYKKRVHLIRQVGALIGPLAPTPQNDGMEFAWMSRAARARGCKNSHQT